MNPAVTVVMPVFNAGKFLHESVSSILSQTLSDFELIAVNDGSSDNSLNILREFSEVDSRLVVIDQKNAGVAAAFNAGFARARGVYVARMDADDIALPDRLKLQRAFLAKNPDCVAVSGWIIVVDQEGDPVANRQFRASHANIIKGLLAQSDAGALDFFCNGASMARADVIRKVGGCRPEFEPTDDRDLWLRMSEEGRLENLQEYLMKCRINPKGLSCSRTFEQRQQSIRAVYEAYSRRGLEPPRTLNYSPIEVENKNQAGQFIRFARCSAAYGYYRTARKHAMRAIIKDPLNFNCYLVLARTLAGRLATPISRFLRQTR